MPATPTPPDAAELPAGSPTVSRERERLFVSPRALVSEPGARWSVLEIFRRFHESRVAYLMLIFVAAGTALFLFGYAGIAGPNRESLQQEADPPFFWGAMAFGGTLVLIALIMIWVAILEEGPSRRPRPEAGREPWARDHPWSRTMKPDRPLGDAVMPARLAFLVIVALLNAAWLSGSWLFYILLTFLDLVALLVVWDMVKKMVQAVRFPQPAVSWEAIPVFPGGALRGRIAFRRRLRAAGPARLTLRCVREEPGARGPEPWAIYRETREAPLPGERGAALDFAFDVPLDLPGTDLSGGEAVYWQVLVDVPLAGPNLEAVFLAPIYRES